MHHFNADLHIHTLLSPCGDLEMSPANIVKRALELDIKILGITDHNSTKHALLVKKLAEQNGIFTLCGAEVTTKEEVHCLAFFETPEKLAIFQQYLDENMSAIKNDPDIFGYQVVIDEDEMIIEEIENLLIVGLNQSIDQVETKVHEAGGLFIPAHIDRSKFSIISQLGFVPPDLNADAFEISRHGNKEDIIKKFPYLKNRTFIRTSDAHQIEQLGSGNTVFVMEHINWKEILQAIKGEDGRHVIIQN